MNLFRSCKMWQTVQRRGCHVKAQMSNGNLDAAKLKLANETIERALRSYQPQELMLCFNGGKDCTALLDVLSKQAVLSPLRVICVKSYDPFEEVEQFINECTQRYQLQLSRYNGLLKLAIEQALLDNPQVRAMFLGCRRSDPGCAQFSDLMPCDNGWPAMMRIFPLLEWSYHDVWSYLRANNVRYCPLYDNGYTSLGDRSTTTRNANLLKYQEEQGKFIYRPAYELTDARLERVNREDNSGSAQQRQT